MIRKANVGAAMLNWRYVGKTFVNREKVKAEIYKEGPNSKPFRYIEINDICRWKNAPRDAATDGRIVWLSEDGKFAKLSYVNLSLQEVPVRSRTSDDSPTHQSILKKISVNQLTLLDINGNPVKKVEVLYAKSGDPMRGSEHGVAIPYQDDVSDKNKSTTSSDTTERDLLKYGKYIAEMQDVDESIFENLDQQLELEVKESKIKTTWAKSKSWISKGTLDKTD